MAVLHQRDEGYALNPQLHPWPPVPKSKSVVGKEGLDQIIEAQLDAERKSREERLIKGGYSDKHW